jgi:hypothetical protein
MPTRIFGTAANAAVSIPICMISVVHVGMGIVSTASVLDYFEANQPFLPTVG